MAAYDAARPGVAAYDTVPPRVAAYVSETAPNVSYAATRRRASMFRVTTWTPGWDVMPQPLLDFWTERHLCALSTLRPDGRPHVVPVGTALDLEECCAWVITNGASQKARNAERSPAVAICQVDGARWSTIEGTARVCTDEVSVARAVERYASRYRQPRTNPLRVALRIEVEQFLVSPRLVPDTEATLRPAR